MFAVSRASCRYALRAINRDEPGAWQHVEIYIRDRSEADFTHGLCPTCAAEYTVAGDPTG